jgi:CRISPR/Cas system CSM-associated protein Csm3 (group 7 of RAMP superfamily)
MTEDVITVPPRLQLRFRLLSDATFGRGEGVPGEVDAEVQHDNLGMPYFGARALKGVLAQECADLLYALGQKSEEDRWWQAAAMLFGRPGSSNDDAGALIVGDAQLPPKLRQAIAYAVLNKQSKKQVISRSQVLASLTTVRKQTANSVETGAPMDQTLRAMRVVLRGTEFIAPLRFRTAVSEDALALLAACVASLRRLGMGRNRGRGEVEAWLTDDQGNPAAKYLERFVTEVAQA